MRSFNSERDIAAASLMTVSCRERTDTIAYTPPRIG